MSKFKTPIIYGMAVALAGSVLMISLIELKLLGPKAISLESDMAGGTILFLMLYLFLLFGIYFAIKKQKEQNAQTITFKEAMLQGFAVSLMTALTSVALTYLFYNVLYTDYVSETLEALRTQMQSANVPTAKLQAKLAEKEEYYSTATQSFFSFVGNLITGITFTLLLSFFLKSKNRKLT